MKFRFWTIFIFLIILCSSSAYAYSDIPSGHWAEKDVSAASELGIINGYENGKFGLGENIKRSEFAAMLCRLFKQSTENAPISAFEDVNDGDWYFTYVNALAANGVTDGKLFRPNDNITRSEMAVMLIKSLGYNNLAQTENENPFTDVSENQGFITLAYKFGIINGKSDTVFDPDGAALREECAAMMMRMHRKYYSKLNNIHGFYAISSWGQRETAAQMDEVSFGWGRLECRDGKAYLNTASDGGNVWAVPDGAQDAVDYMKSNGVKMNFAVTMTDLNDSRTILTNPQNRSAAADQIIAAAENFDGVTIDFEGMSGSELKNGLNEFIKELRNRLGERSLYIAVHPVLKNSSEYYDAYDCKTLGEYADRIILMTHDYASLTIPDHLLNTEFTATPVTPFDEVYTALKAITDPTNGVTDVSKIQLGISLSSAVAWETQNGKIISKNAIIPTTETILKRLSQNNTVIKYSNQYRNPYAEYTTEDGKNYLLWYEDARSTKDKIDLAKMFGINSLSIWRIGTISNSQPEHCMDIWNTILSCK